MTKVLMIAEAANPEWVSVPLVGWNIYRAMAARVDVHLVTHPRNRDAIERAGLSSSNYTIIDNERVASPLYRLSSLVRGGAGKGWTTITAFSSLAYYSFEIELWRVFKERLMAREFDLVHRVTPLSPTSQSLLAKWLSRINVPFIVGPINGGVPWPKTFKDRQFAEREWLSSVRRLYKLMPAYWSMRRYSSAIIVGSKFTESDMPVFARAKCVYIPENGVRLDQVLDEGAAVQKTQTLFGRRELVATFVGRLVAYKGADMAVEAAQEHLRSGRLKLNLIGEGPERQRIEQIVQQLGVEHSVRFYGNTSHGRVMEVLRESDFMLLPSIREFGGGVVIEAMASATTPVVANYAGPAELVDNSTGLRIPFSDRQSLIHGMKEAIDRLVAHPETLCALGRAARAKVLEKLTWEAKADQIHQVYRLVLRGGPVKQLKFF